MTVTNTFLCLLTLVVLVLDVDTRATPNQKRCTYTESRKLMNCQGEEWDDVPYEHIGGKIINTLDLGNNNIQEMKNISGFGELLDSSQLTELLLYHNKLSKIPSDLYRELPELLALDLSYNNITHVSASICHFKNLTYLGLRGNAIKNIARRARTCLPNLKIDEDVITSVSLPISSEAPVSPSVINSTNRVIPSHVNVFTTNDDNHQDKKSEGDDPNKGSKVCVRYTVIFILFAVIIIGNS